MSYIGSSATPLPVAFSGVRTQSFNGTGSQTAFTLSRAVSAVTDIEVVVNNVQQSPFDSSYNISGATLTFSEAPSSGTNNIYVIFRDQPVGSLTDPTSVKKTGDTITGPMVQSAASGNNTYQMETASTTSGHTNRFSFKNAAGAADVRSGVVEWYDNSIFMGDIRLLKAGGVAVRNSADVETFKVDNAGRVTMPYQPAFSVSKSNGGAQATEVVFNNVYENRGSHYNATTGRFTAPVSGMYLFSAALMLSGTNNFLLWKFLKNGATDTMNQWFQAHAAAVTNNITQTGTVVVSLVAGDYVSVNVASSYPNYYTTGYNVFSGYLIG